MDNKVVKIIGILLTVFFVLYIFERPTRNMKMFAAASGSDDQCSKPCGGGMQQRDVYCVDASGTRVTDDLCDKSKKPVENQQCNVTPCGKWIASAWSECVNGKQTRTYTCETGKICVEPQPAPETRECGQVYSWKTGPWVPV